jgi:hypothetical protein
MQRCPARAGPQDRPLLHLRRPAGPGPAQDGAEPEGRADGDGGAGPADEASDGGGRDVAVHHHHALRYHLPSRYGGCDTLRGMRWETRWGHDGDVTGTGCDTDQMLSHARGHAQGWQEPGVL